MTQNLENNARSNHQDAALAAVKVDYPKYFEALQKHPRMLVGQTVPRIDGQEGTETLRDSQDAADWQEAVKSLLTDEIAERTERLMEQDRGSLEILNSSIALFQNNPDLVPGTKQFNRQLADTVMNSIRPYAVKDEESGKLVGFSIPVQPLIEHLRTALKNTPPPAAPAAPAAAAAKAPAKKAAPPPQRGITAKPGNAGEQAEDYSVLFGTLGIKV